MLYKAKLGFKILYPPIFLRPSLKDIPVNTISIKGPPQLILHCYISKDQAAANSEGAHRPNACASPISFFASGCSRLRGLERTHAHTYARTVV